MRDGHDEEADQEQPPVRSRRGWVLPALLGLVLAVLVAAAVVQYRDRGEGAAEAVRPADIGAPRQDPDGLAGSAVLAARRAVIAFYRLDHRHAARDLARLGPLSTEEFAAAREAMAQRLERRVRRQRLVSRPRLPDDGTATEYLTAEAAQILVSVDVSTRRGQGRAGVESRRTRVDLERVDGAWLVAGLDEVR